MIYSENMEDTPTPPKRPSVRPMIQVPRETHELIRRLADAIAREKGLDSLSMAQTVGIVAREAAKKRKLALDHERGAT